MKNTGTINLHVLALALFSFFVVPMVYAADSRPPAKTVLTNGHLIDCTGAPARENVSVVIEGNRIAAILSGEYRKQPGEENIRVLDLEGGYVLPGLWNVHMHLAALLPDPNHIQEGEPLPSAVIRAGLNAMDGLRRGFTAVRTVGEDEWLDVAWRDAFDQGFFLGPRLFTSGDAISPTGGHRGDFADGADGPDAVLRAVRTQIQNGVDWIKIMEVEMLDSEVAAAVEAAHHMGLRVAAHSKEPTTFRSVRLGVDCIEHGYGIQDETLALMAEKGTFYVPTIICNLSDRYIRERDRRLEELGYSRDEKVAWGRTLVAYADERSQKHAEHQRRALRKAFELGVKVCVGSDSTPVGEIGLLEIEQFVLSGVDEMDALVAATRNGADLCGVLDKLGTVETGKLADLIVVGADPLDNISNLRRLKMVFKDGVSVNLDRRLGTAEYWDYFRSDGLRTGSLADAEEAAGFQRGKVKK